MTFGGVPSEHGRPERKKKLEDVPTPETEFGSQLRGPGVVTSRRPISRWSLKGDVVLGEVRPTQNS